MLKPFQNARKIIKYTHREGRTLREQNRELDGCQPIEQLSVVRKAETHSEQGVRCTATLISEKLPIN